MTTDEDLKTEIARLNIRLAQQERAMNVLCNKKKMAFLDPLFTPFKLIGKKIDELSYKSKIKKIATMHICVHIHLYYEDLSTEFVNYLKNIPIPFDLFITTVNTDIECIKNLFKEFNSVTVLCVPNKGRDIGAFLVALHAIDLNAYDVLIKIHTKKSLGRDTDGAKWRTELIDPLLGSKAKAATLLYSFKKRQKLGMVGSKKHLTTLGMEQYRLFFDLCERLKIQPYPLYFKGTMFAIRCGALTPLKESGISMVDMTEKMTRSDGYLEHALERTFGSLCAKNALTVKDI